MKAVALSIAGSDPSGGAGIQADLKTFHQFGVYGEAVVTLLTVQNTKGVSRVACVEAELVRQQIAAVIEDIPPGAVKTGALGNAELVQAVSAAIAELRCPVVVDPVMISKHGASLLDGTATSALLQKLLPRAALVTPNVAEAAALSGREVNDPDSIRVAARIIHDATGAGVLVKGGHLEGPAIDLLYWRGDFLEFQSQRIVTSHTHGTGCTYSAAITACLALGLTVPESVARAKVFITRAIRSSPRLGHGAGPVNHHANPTIEK
jgi:hydroxymethylpyrimidine/phosphomethylpyrimidine kinase